MGFADLKGKAAAMPLHSRCHCELFLTHGIEGGDAKGFFKEFQRPSNSEDALDDLVDGRYEGVILDVVALESYQRRSRPRRPAQDRPQVRAVPGHGRRLPPRQDR